MVTSKMDTHGRAMDRMAWTRSWYRDLGFEIQVPIPDVNDAEYERRKSLEIPQAMFYRPATSEVSYEAFMEAVGQGWHWTVGHADREKIGWEPTAQGYWYWAEVSPECPRLYWTWLNLMDSVRLLSLEEYVIVWYAHKAATGRDLDVPTWCWLRTRYDLSALDACEHDGEVDINTFGVRGLSRPSNDEGGRATEMIASAA